jgi:hypothetical protein
MTTPTIDQYLNIDKYHAPQWLGTRAARRFHVMVKPAGSTCNLDCTYCFYLSKQTLPGGPGVGKIFHFGKLPVNTQISAYYNVVKPDFGANWQIRAQVQFMFPK